ncbi:glutamine--fructose-6-phosphate transaminase (isomerizing) [Marinoscillum luteum]|uniref:Glutamine--fructose-6-phosphate aminotransferase [isomerizing] n=1 Tax=Marinoscillum luteum TaxID=861051 RepID=A0ABW7NCE2_9BACT
MCGIVAYKGSQDSIEVILKGLKRLEYRGYDSAGIAGFEYGKLVCCKKQGKVSELENKILEDQFSFDHGVGIGHTRWATHGEPNDKNAHPHLSQDGSLAIIHNGIIENYGSLKKELEIHGYEFASQTDTEVLVNFIHFIRESENLSTEEAFRLALKRVIGAYAVVMLSNTEPDYLFAARKGSPMVIGINQGEYFIASDATPIVEYTNEVIYLKESEIAIISSESYTIKNLDNAVQDPRIQTIDMELEAIEKGGYDHFMQKEVFEQPESIANCMRGRLVLEKGELVLGGINEYSQSLIHAKKITLLGCGTSWHAGLVAEYLFEDICRIPVEVEYASEFRYRNPIINEGDVFIAISQSGETADTLAAIELAKSKGAIVFGVVNVVGSSIARETHEGAYLHAGPEIGVASTKAFTAQVTVLSMIAIKMGLLRGTISQSQFQLLISELNQIPKKVATALKNNDQIEALAEIYKDAQNFLYLGRGNNFPVALEGALKLKEISYIHAEGYPAAEMKHGPIALIDEDMPVVFIATQDDSYEKIVSNIQEVKSRKGKVIAIVTEGDILASSMADYSIEIPKSHYVVTPLLSVIPLQLLSYHIALKRGCNVDQPRNLAKSVTVE